MARGATSKQVRQSAPTRTVRTLPILFLLLFVGAGVGLYFGSMEFFERYPIQKVKVVGELNYVDRAELQDKLAPFVNHNFFSIELDKVKNVAESLTWIEHADAKKEWPNTLVVTLQERVPIAIWGENALLSKKGEIFSADYVHLNVTLPTFIGRTEQVAIIANRFLEMQKILLEVDLSISMLELEDRVSWKVQLDDGLMLVIDEKHSLEKLKRFTNLYRLFSDEQKKKLFKVDLRYENGLAIKWKKQNGDTNAA